MDVLGKDPAKVTLRTSSTVGQIAEKSISSPSSTTDSLSNPLEKKADQKKHFLQRISPFTPSKHEFVALRTPLSLL